jgi:hypothetical protein
VSADTFIRLETFGLENVRVGEIFFVAVKGVDLHGNGSSGWDCISSQFRIFTHVSRDVGNGRIKSKGFFDAAFEVFQFSCVFHSAGTIGISKDIVQFFFN